MGLEKGLRIHLPGGSAPPGLMLDMTKAPVKMSLEVTPPGLLHAVLVGVPSSRCSSPSRIGAGQSILTVRSVRQAGMISNVTNRGAGHDQCRLNPAWSVAHCRGRCTHCRMPSSMADRHQKTYHCSWARCTGMIDPSISRGAGCTCIDMQSLWWTHHCAEDSVEPCLAHPAAC